MVTVFQGNWIARPGTKTKETVSTHRLSRKQSRARALSQSLTPTPPSANCITLAAGVSIGGGKENLRVGVLFYA